MLATTYDGKQGLIRSVSSGFHTVDQVMRYLACLDEAFLACRREHGRVRHFIDSADAAVQSAEVMELFRIRQPDLTGPDDRLAVLKSSTLARMQAVRNFRSDKERVFGTEEEALAWLLEDQTSASPESPSQRS